MTDLIRANLSDPLARHLLIICSGDEALEQLQVMVGPGRQQQMVLGSPFQEDHTDDYKYRWERRGGGKGGVSIPYRR